MVLCAAHSVVVAACGQAASDGEASPGGSKVSGGAWGAPATGTCPQAPDVGYISQVEIPGQGRWPTIRWTSGKPKGSEEQAEQGAL